MPKCFIDFVADITECLNWGARLKASEITGMTFMSDLKSIELHKTASCSIHEFSIEAGYGWDL